VERVNQAIDDRGWEAWVQLIASSVNGGFSAGNNIGIRGADADYYLLLNSDTIVRPGAIASLLEGAERDPETGLLGPRLEWPDGRPKVSACVLIRREVVETVGYLDEGYFMYFEDGDYCRTAAKIGWKVMYWPQAHVIHLRGGSGPVKAMVTARKRRPRRFYAARSRYFAKFYGVPGLWTANILWELGRFVALLSEIFRRRPPHNCAHAYLDIWTHALSPLKRPTGGSGSAGGRVEPKPETPEKARV